MAVKDDIKALGGYSFHILPSTGFWGLLSNKMPGKAWYKIVSLDTLETEIKKAGILNPVLKNNITEVDLATFAQVKQINDDKASKKAEALKDIKKPIVPIKISGKMFSVK